MSKTLEFAMKIPRPDSSKLPENIEVQFILEEHPTVGGLIIRNTGHPWHGHSEKAGGQWDGMDLLATSEADLKVIVEAAEKKFWKAWICGTCAHPDFPFGAYLYKPSGIEHDWEDIPGKRFERAKRP